MIIHSSLARHVSVLLGYLYPSLASAKAAVQQDPDAFTQWMTYWVVMSVFALLEIFVDFFVSWVPLYYEAKIVLIVWLALPRYQGASRIYRRLLSPYLEQYEGDIDSGLEGMRVEAKRRIQSLGVSAASEITKAVTRQGSSAKEQLFARVLGIAAAVATTETAAVDDKAAARSAPPSPAPKRIFEQGGRQQLPGGTTREGGEDEDGAAADAEMLLDFAEVMTGGVFVQARSTFSGEQNEPWRPRQIRMVHGTAFSMIDSGGGSGAEVEGGNEQRFQVLGAETKTSSDRSLLLLQTDRGRVELSLPGLDDRDTMMAGFEVLLASVSAAIATKSAASCSGERTPNRRLDPIVHRCKSRQWDRPEGRGGMVLESADEDSSDEHGEQEVDVNGDAPPPRTSPLKESHVEVG